MYILSISRSVNASSITFHFMTRDSHNRSWALQ
jgi:hypothetical protein